MEEATKMPAPPLNGFPSSASTSSSYRVTSTRHAIAHDILEKAKKNARRKENYRQDNFEFTSIWDHILPSQCEHAEGENVENCSICLYERELASLPHLPEMIFPENQLIIQWINKESKITFNTLDALKLVNTEKFPDVQVASSAAWQESRKDMSEFKRFGKPFDWTYSTTYEGTLYGLKEEPTDERIDIEFLKRQDPIKFYAQNNLYEDELHDNGTAQMTVRIRVHPSWFFLLVRFYLRVDHVLVKVIDTRIFGRTNEESVLREWTVREAPIGQLKNLDPECLLDQNQIWMHLPLVKSKYSKISPL